MERAGFGQISFLHYVKPKTLNNIAFYILIPKIKFDIYFHSKNEGNNP